MKMALGYVGRSMLLFCMTAGFAGAASAQKAAPASDAVLTESGPTSATRALAKQEASLGQAKNEFETFYITTRLAPLAYTAGDMTGAAGYAEILLKRAGSMKDDWNYGNALHTANLVLGRIALAGGKTDDAKRFLLEAGRTPGSPQLDSFGPDMLFAKEMLERGESKTVLEYFTLCAAFWKRDDGKLAEWKAVVEKDEVPDFGANLRYIF